MEKLRRVVPLEAFTELELKAIGQNNDFGKRPELRWVHPGELYVDEGYQRELAKRSVQLIKKFVLGFSWRKLKPPIVVEVEGKLHCVDGQHTAIAAVTRGIPEIPVFVVEALTQKERADSFVSHNQDRLQMTSFNVFLAKVAAGDAAAIDTAQTCRRAGINFRTSIKDGNVVKPGDTSCVLKVHNLVRRHGPAKARRVLEALVKAGRSDISVTEIDSAEALMLVARPDLSVEVAGSVISAVGRQGMLRARLIGSEQKRPHKNVLLEMYLENLKKRAA